MKRPHPILPRIPPRILLRTLATLAVLYILFCLTVWTTHLGDSLIVADAPGPLPAPGATRILIPFQDGQLEAFSATDPPNETPALTLLYFTGNHDRVNPWTAGLARHWHQLSGLPVEAVGINLPGFGESTPPARLNRFGPAGLAAYDYLHAQNPNRPIAIHAASLGTTAALCIAANRPVAALSLQDPPPIPQLVLEYHGRWNLWLLAIPVWLQLPSDIDSLANAPRVTAPTLLITSSADTVIPPPFQDRIYNALAGPKLRITLPNARHCTQPSDPALVAQITAARRKLLVQSQVTGPPQPNATPNQ